MSSQRIHWGLISTQAEQEGLGSTWEFEKGLRNKKDDYPGAALSSTGASNHIRPFTFKVITMKKNENEKFLGHVGHHSVTY